MAMAPQQKDIPDNAEVFTMRGTNEVFTEYEKYIRRYIQPTTPLT